MGVNFGQYQGHVIMSNAVNAALDRIERAHTQKNADKKWEREMELKEDNSARNAKADTLNNQIRELQLSNLESDKKLAEFKKAQVKKMYADNSLPLFDSEGNLVDNYQDQFKALDEKTSYANILKAAELAGVDLSQEDLRAIQMGGEDLYKQLGLQIDKRFAGMDADEIQSFVDSNTGFGKNVRSMLLGAGTPISADIELGEYLSGGSYGTGNPEINKLDNKWGQAITSGQDYGYSEYNKDKNIHSKLYDDNAKNRRQRDLIADALMRSKNMQKNLALTDDADDLWIDQNAAGEWTIAEDDGMLRGGNDIFEVKIENGVPRIAKKGTNNWTDLSNFKDWD